MSRSRTMVYQGAADRLFRYSRPAYAVWTLHGLRSTAYSAYASHQVLENSTHRFEGKTHPLGREGKKQGADSLTA